MARPPSRYHPFHTVREVFAEAWGVKKAGTQEFFATMLGSPKSAITIKRIEAGSLKLSRHLAALVTAGTGVDTMRIIKGDLGNPQTVDGKEFSAETFEEWERDLDKSHEDRLCECMSEQVRNLLKRANREGGTPHLRKTFCQLAATIGEQNRELDIRHQKSPEETIETMLPGIEILRTCTADAKPREGLRHVRFSFEELFASSAAMKRSDPNSGGDVPEAKQSEKGKPGKKKS